MEEMSSPLKRFPNERHQRIAALVAERGQISIGDLIAMFEASGPTIRRDLTFLAQAGLVVRTHGGVAATARSNGQEPLFLEKLRRQQSAKASIAKRAQAHVRDGMRLIVDSGTTCLALARLLAGRRVTIVTLDIKSAEAAATGETEVIVPAGRLRNGYFNLVGREAVSAIGSEPEADIFFLSADAVDGSGVSNVTEEEADVKQAAIDRAGRTILLADHTKLERREPADVCTWDAVDLFITDRHAAGLAKTYARSVRGIEFCNPGTKTKETLE